MANKSPAQQQFYSMFIEQLKDIYCGEKQYIEAMPKYLEAIKTGELKERLQTHFDETKKQQHRLTQIFDELGESPQEGTCEGISGLLRGCDKIVSQDVPGIVKDAALICALQKIEHFEIATYGALRTFAKHLNLGKVQQHLQDILDEEWKTDQKLTSLAEGGWLTSGINAEAVQ